MAYSILLLSLLLLCGVYAQQQFIQVKNFDAQNCTLHEEVTTEYYRLGTCLPRVSTSGSVRFSLSDTPSGTIISRTTSNNANCNGPSVVTDNFSAGVCQSKLQLRVVTAVDVIEPWNARTSVLRLGNCSAPGTINYVSVVNPLYCNPTDQYTLLCNATAYIENDYNTSVTVPPASCKQFISNTIYALPNNCTAYSSVDIYTQSCVYPDLNSGSPTPTPTPTPNTPPPTSIPTPTPIPTSSPTPTPTSSSTSATSATTSSVTSSSTSSTAATSTTSASSTINLVASTSSSPAATSSTTNPSSSSSSSTSAASSSTSSSTATVSSSSSTATSTSPSSTTSTSSPTSPTSAASPAALFSFVVVSFVSLIYL